MKDWRLKFLAFCCLATMGCTGPNMVLGVHGVYKGDHYDQGTADKHSDHR